MSMQDLYDKYFNKLLEESEIKVSCPPQAVPKLRTGLTRSQKNYKLFNDSFTGTEEYRMKVISVSYNREDHVATVTLSEPYQDGAIFKLL